MPDDATRREPSALLPSTPPVSPATSPSAATATTDDHPATPPPGAGNQPRRVAHGPGWLTGPLSRALTVFALVFVVITAGHQIVDSLLARLDRATPVHEDRSTFGKPAMPQVKPQLRLAYRNQNGEVVRVLVDVEAFSAFAVDTFAHLERAKRDALARVAAHVETALGPVRMEAEARVPRYADWYFAWPTGYAIMGEAAKSLANHAMATEVMYLKDQITYDVGQHVLKHYQEIVLYPEKSDAEIQRAYQSAYYAAHHDYKEVLADLDLRFQDFVGRKTTHTMPPDAEGKAAELDWESQVRKLRLTTHERGNVFEAARAGMLTTTGAVLGPKIATAAAAKAATGKAIVAAGEQMALKFAAPFVAKALSAGASAAGAAAVGSVAGPVGTAVGVGVGVAVDYAVNKGIALATRDEFERDTRETVSATFAEWKLAMVEAIQADAGVWYEDTIQLLGSYRQKN